MTDRHIENVSGPLYVNNQCIYCGLCVEFAPGNFKKHQLEEYAYVFKQPETPEELLQCEEARTECPYDAIK